MSAILVTDVIDRDLLKTISSSPQIENQNWFVAVDFSELDIIRRSVKEGTYEAIQGYSFLLFIALFWSEIQPSFLSILYLLNKTLYIFGCIRKYVTCYIAEGDKIV